MITDVAGVLVGHWTDAVAKTGCTVVVFPEGTVGSGEIRGGAPATREFALLDPTKMMQTVDAVVLSGGSAFGLSAADGVVAGLEAQSRGFSTKVGSVPIVVGMSLFDLAVGDAKVRPGPAEGAAAFAEAAAGPYAVGLVGAGTGATVDKWSGDAKPAGLGTATIQSGPLVVSALIAVNAFGAIDDGTSTADIGPPVRPDPEDADADPNSDAFQATGERENTTIGVVVTNAAIDKVGCQLMAQSAHDGLARSLLPAHTSADGDGIVVGATGQLDAESVDQMHLRALVQAVVAMAVRSVRST
ncbi:MAG: P1 family peptidase [Acidimicrobiales bacterium]